VGRRRTINKHLPKGVFSVKNGHGREYFYFQLGRGTKHAGPRVMLGKDTTDPEFWRKLRDANRAPTRVGAWSALIAVTGARKIGPVCGQQRASSSAIA
jgi:hypothetical protein